MSQFIAVSIENQLLLETSPLEQSAENILSMSPRGKEEGELESVTSRIGSGATALAISSEQPSVEKEAARSSKDVAWGLYNRIFPVKITLRVLSQLLTKEGSQSVDLKVLREEASLQAKLVAKRLGAGSRRTRYASGERLFTGLPFKNSWKASERFKNMFVGTITKSGKAEGFPVLLRFIVIRRAEGRALVSLTEAGYSFARLENPVLDDASGNTPSSTLSMAEADFYMSHIEDAVPREWDLCKKVIENIAEGVNTAKSVDDIVKRRVHEIQPGLVPATRSGVISRLSELGLVQRRQDGFNVIYKLTPHGEAFLKAVQAGSR